MGGLTALLGCEGRSREEKPVTTTSETTRKTEEGTSSVRTETKQVGSTEETTTETKTETPQGDVRTTTNIYVGTVTALAAGESIEVMTGKKETHRFDLDDRNLVVSVDPRTTVGAKVKLVEEKGDKGFHRITVTLAPGA